MAFQFSSRGAWLESLATEASSRSASQEIPYEAPLFSSVLLLPLF
jgi:hypothetical protein